MKYWLRALCSESSGDDVNQSWVNFLNGFTLKILTNRTGMVAVYEQLHPQNTHPKWIV